MNKTWVVFALILIIAGQLIALSSFHEVSGEGLSDSNAVITIAKLNYVDARITLTIEATPPIKDTNESTNVKIVFPDGTTHNLTYSNTDTSKTYTKTFDISRTDGNFGSGEGSYSTGNNSISVSQEEPLAMSIKYNVDDPQSYRLTHSNQVMQVSTFIIYGGAIVSVRGYGVAL